MASCGSCSCKLKDVISVVEFRYNVFSLLEQCLHCTVLQAALNCKFFVPQFDTCCICMVSVYAELHVYIILKVHLHHLEMTEIQTLTGKTVRT